MHSTYQHNLHWLTYNPSGRHISCIYPLETCNTLRCKPITAVVSHPFMPVLIKALCFHNALAGLWHIILDYAIGQHYVLTHRGRVRHICITKLGYHYIGSWLIAYLAPSHYLNQWCVIISWIPENRLQRFSIQKWSIFVIDSAFQKVVCKTVAICVLAWNGQLNVAVLSIDVPRNSRY